MPSENGCESCGASLDPSRYARCDVCRGSRYCIGCAREHLCTARCLTNGCIRGLCVHVVRAGVTDERWGVHE